MQSADVDTGSGEPSLGSSLPEHSFASSRPDVPGGANDVTCEVLVIGAGVAGLTAANELLKRDPAAQICIIEAKDRVGGRTLATEMRVKGGATETFELGGQWVGTAQTHIMQTLDELGLEVHQQYTTGTSQMQLGGSKIRRYDKVPNIGSWWGLIQLARFMKKLDRLSEQCSPLSADRDRVIRELDSFTLEAFARQYLSNAALEFMLVYCRAIYGVEANRVSLVQFLSDVHSSGGIDAAMGTGSDSSQEFTVKGGTHQISQLLADKIGRQRLHLRQAVTSISQHGDGVTVTTAAGTTFHCRYVISSMPPNQLARIQFEPPLNLANQELIKNMHMGHLIKFFVTFEKTFWRDAGLSGVVTSSGGGLSAEPGCETGPVCVTFDATTHQGSPALVGFIAGNTSVQWQSRTKREREEAVITHLSKFFGEEVEQYIEYQEKVWAEESYIGGAPGCCTVPGMSSFPALQKQHGNVFFCGTEFATQWSGYLSGAVQTGRQMAVEALHALRPGCLSDADLELIGKRRPWDTQSRRRPVANTSPVWHNVLRVAAAPFVALVLLIVNRRFLGGGLAAISIDF